MKITSLTQVASGLILALALNVDVAKAALISGSINFDGVATTNTGNLSAATAFSTIYGTAVVAGETGNYSAIPTVTPVTFTPFSFTAAGVTPLWTLTYLGITYSFNATSIVVNSQSADFLNLSGTGIANITGMTSTAGIWSITDTSVGGGPIFTFGGDSAVSGVPDSGTTAMLIVLGFAGIGMAILARRRKIAQAARNCARLLPIGIVLVLAIPLMDQHAMAAADVSLGTANNFAVLAGSTVTNTGSTVINGGNVGLFPGTSITGFPPATIAAPYTTHAADGVALMAQNDLTNAFTAAAGLSPTQTLTGQDLGGLTLTPGVYSFASSAQLTGALTLNDQGNPDAVFVFQIGSTLTTASNSSVVSINDPATPGISVFWQVGSSATLGTGTAFEGNILAATSITADGGASVYGRLLAETGAVTLDGNLISAPPAEVIAGGGGSSPSSVPDAGSTLLLLGAGLMALFAFYRRSFSPV